METGEEKRDIARSLWQKAVFCKESFGKNQTLYIHLTYKDVDRFQKGWVHELYCLKASQVSKVTLVTFLWDNNWADCGMSSIYENTGKK